MDYTRVDTKKLVAAVAKAAEHLEQAETLLRPYLATLTDAERTRTPRAPNAFPDAGRTLARAAAKHPEVAAVADFDAGAVTEDIDNAAALAPVMEKLEHLVGLVNDTRLTWLSEAWIPSLALYAVAKVKAKTDGALRAVVEPLATVFATQRGRSKKPEGG